MELAREIVSQIGLPENDRLKYEPLLPSSSELGKLICAFANTDGGILILGVLNKNKKISIKGLSTDFQVKVVLTNAISRLSPSPSIQSDFILYQDKQLFAIKVVKSALITSYNQIPYIIQSKNVVKLTSISDSQSKKRPTMPFDKYLDQIIKYLVDNPGLINVNKHTVRETILEKKVSITEAEQMISKLRASGYVKSYGDRYIGVSIESKQFLDKGGFSSQPAVIDSGTPKKIFISYNWINKTAASKLYDVLKAKGYEPSIDDHNLKYKDSISTFMESIRAADFAILIISDQYLKSENCMIEVLHVLKDRESYRKILPIRHEDVKIFKPADRLKYVEYWNSQVAGRAKMLEGIDPTTAIEEIKKLRNARRIYQDIGDFLSDVADMITNTIEEQERTAFQNIVDYIEQ